MFTSLISSLSVLSFIGYFWTNKRPHAHSFETSLDKKIKVIPIFVIPYIFLFPYIFATYITLAGNDILSKFSLTLIIVNVTSTIFWYKVPNGVIRNLIYEPNIFSKVINWIYKHDGDTNGFPSGHVFLSVICSYYLNVMYSNLSIIWILSGFLISISTIFTKQHYVVDILGGVLFAIFSILISNIVL